jgi:hypothetical protein
MAKEGVDCFRFDPNLEHKIDLDDLEKVRGLEEMSKRYLDIEDSVIGETCDVEKEIDRMCAKPG